MLWHKSFAYATLKRQRTIFSCLKLGGSSPQKETLIKNDLGAKESHFDASVDVMKAVSASAMSHRFGLVMVMGQGDVMGDR